MICPFFWDALQKNQLLPSNQKASCKSASVCSFSRFGVRNALLGCDTEILYVTVMGIVLTLTDFPPSSIRDEIRRASTTLSPGMSAVAEHGFNVEPHVRLQGTTILPLKSWAQQHKQGGWSGGEKGMETFLLLSHSRGSVLPPWCLH
jgi:hypothetical protein